MTSIKNVRYRGGYPLLHRVLKTDPEGAWSLRRAIAEFSTVAANDNHSAASDYAGDDDFEPAGPSAEALHDERRHRTQPSINGMLADLLRPRIVRHSNGTIFRHAGPQDLKIVGRDRFRLGDMVFSTDEAIRRPEVGGLMLSYAWTKSGAPVEPVVDTREPKGGHRGTARSPSSIAKYMKMPGAVSSPLHCDGLRPAFSEERIVPDMFDPLPQAVTARKILAEAIENTPVMPPVKKLPDAIARGARFVGGISAGRNDARRPVDVWEGGNDAGDKLSDRSREIINEVASRGTLKSLGIRLGYSHGYADRAAKAALWDLVAELKRIFPPPPRIAANDNLKTPGSVPFRAA